MKTNQMAELKQNFQIKLFVVMLRRLRQQCRLSINYEAQTVSTFDLNYNCYTFYGLVGWRRKYMEREAAYECHS